MAWLQCIYLTLLLQLHICRAVLMHLRSANNGDNNTPGVLSSFGQRSFSVSGPDAWNRISRDLRGISVASTFKRHLKAELFSRAYGVSLADSSVTVYSKPYIGHFRARCFIDVTCLMLFILTCFCYCSTL